jgi:hypothetical protein
VSCGLNCVTFVILGVILGWAIPGLGMPSIHNGPWDVESRRRDVRRSSSERRFETCYIVIWVLLWVTGFSEGAACSRCPSLL